MRSLVLFNNKGGVGKTTLTYNLGHMLALRGRRVLLVDYDPQCNLTALALDDDQCRELWAAPSGGDTVATALDPIRRGRGDLLDPVCRELDDDVYLLPGDIQLSRFEAKLAKSWPEILSVDPDAALHVVTALGRLAERAAESAAADIILFDVGPSLGALNQAVLVAADAVIIPLAPDLFSLRGLENVGETLDDWRQEWESNRIRLLQRAARRSERSVDLPEHPMKPIGYIVQQQVRYADSPIRASQAWLASIPGDYRRHVLRHTKGLKAPPSIQQDPLCIGVLGHYASLVPLAQAAHKPLFRLTHADGVAGSQFQTVARARQDLERMAGDIARRLDALGA